MKYNKIGRVVLGLVVGFMIAFSSKSYADFTYSVKSGDTLYLIGRNYSVTAASIRTANNLSNNNIHINQKLTIPTNKIIQYKVRSGDTLWKISQKYNTSVSLIISLNNSNSNHLRVGQVLIIKPNTNNSRVNSIISYAKRFIGTPYVFGGNSLISGIDCSGFTQKVMAKFNIYIPRVSRDQAKVGEWVARGALRAGDLVFFDLQNAGYISHVGIYIGDNQFIAASSSKGVKISSLSGYFDSKYVTARRVVGV